MCVITSDNAPSTILRRVYLAASIDIVSFIPYLSQCLPRYGIASSIYTQYLSLFKLVGAHGTGVAAPDTKLKVVSVSASMCDRWLPLLPRESAPGV
jgi:hypothetical protein